MLRDRLIAAALIATIAAGAGITAAGAALAGLGFYLWPTAKRIDAITARVDKTSATLLDCTWTDAQGKKHGNGNCLPSQILAISGSIRTASGAIAKSMPEIAGAAKAASSHSVEASEQAAIAAKETTGLVQDARAAAQQLTADLKALHGLIVDLDTGAKDLLGSADETVKAAGAALEQLMALERDLNQAVQEGSPKVREIADAMLAILNDEAIAETLGNIEAGTESGAEILKTVDEATRGLRQKAGRVKWLIGKIVGLLKITVPLF